MDQEIIQPKIERSDELDEHIEQLERRLCELRDTYERELILHIGELERKLRRLQQQRSYFAAEEPGVAYQIETPNLESSLKTNECRISNESVTEPLQRNVTPYRPGPKSFKSSILQNSLTQNTEEGVRKYKIVQPMVRIAKPGTSLQTNDSRASTKSLQKSIKLYRPGPKSFKSSILYYQLSQNAVDNSETRNSTTSGAIN